MKIEVKFSQFDSYWVAVAENGAVSQGTTLDECRENIIDAIAELAKYEKENHAPLAQTVELLEVAI